MKMSNIHQSVSPITKEDLTKYSFLLDENKMKEYLSPIDTIEFYMDDIRQKRKLVLSTMYAGAPFGEGISPSDTAFVLDLMVNAFCYPDYMTYRMWTLGAANMEKGEKRLSPWLDTLYPHLKLSHSLSEIKVQIDKNCSLFVKRNEHIALTRFIKLKEMILEDKKQGKFVKYNNNYLGGSFDDLYKLKNPIAYRIRNEILGDTVLTNRIELKSIPK